MHSEPGITPRQTSLHPDVVSIGDNRRIDFSAELCLSLLADTSG